MDCKSAPPPDPETVPVTVQLLPPAEQLRKAAVRNAVDEVRQLLSSQRDDDARWALLLDTECRGRVTALHVACGMGAVDVAKVLVSEMRRLSSSSSSSRPGAKCPEYVSPTPWMMVGACVDAFTASNFDTLLGLATADELYMKDDPCHNTLFHIAAEGFSPENTTADGLKAAVLAKYYKHGLLNAQGRTALHIACMRQIPSLLWALAPVAAKDLLTRDADGFLPMQHLLFSRRKTNSGNLCACLDALCAVFGTEHGCLLPGVNETVFSGSQTMLHRAIALDLPYVYISQFTLGGADWGAKDEKGCTPIDLASPKLLKQIVMGQMAAIKQLKSELKIAGQTHSRTLYGPTLTICGECANKKRAPTVPSCATDGLFADTFD
jgi:hypothetical protein